jgi:hypothetical protein
MPIRVFGPYGTGTIALRGLQPGKYTIVDYVHDKPLGNGARADRGAEGGV